MTITTVPHGAHHAVASLDFSDTFRRSSEDKVASPELLETRDVSNHRRHVKDHHLCVGKLPRFTINLELDVDVSNVRYSALVDKFGHGSNVVD